MEYGNVQVLPVRPASAPQPPTATGDSLRHAEFECRWAGDPATLQDLILARVDWGPFEVACRQPPRTEGICLCTVFYAGPLRERPHLMASFWYVIERFPFYLGHARKTQSRMPERQPGTGNRSALHTLRAFIR